MFRLIKFLLRFAIYSLVLLCILAGAGIALLLFSPAANQFVAEEIASRLSTVDQDITITGADGLLTGHLRAETITIADTKGPVASLSNLEIDWNPWALLSGQFAASRIAASKVAAMRLPVTTLEKPASTQPFTLPVELDIQSLALPEVVLGAALAGTQKSVSIDGKVTAVADEIKAILDIVDRERPDATGSIDLAFNPSTSILALTAKIDEPEDGILAHLLKLPDSPPVSIQISGNGPLTNWTGNLQAAVSAKPVLALDFEHRLSTSGMHDIRLTGGGEITSIVPPYLRGVLSGMATVNVDATFQTDGTVSISRGEIGTETLNIAASGRLDPNGQSDLTASLTPKDNVVAFAWPLTGGQLQVGIETLSLTLSGPATATKLALVAKLQTLTLPQGTLSGVSLSGTSSDFNLQSRTGTLNMDLAVDQASLTDANLARLVEGPIEIKAPVLIAEDRIIAKAATVESGRIGGTLDVQLDRATNAVQSSFKLFALPIVLSGTMADKIDGTIAISGDATVLNGGVAVTGLDVTATGLKASGGVSLAQGLLKADLTASLSDIGQLTDGASGTVSSQISASGPLNAVIIAVELQSDKLKLAGRDVTNLTAEIKATASSTKPTAHVQATGRIDGQAIDILADLVSEKGVPAIPAVKVAIGKNVLSGALTFSPAFRPSGSITFDLPDIGLVAALAGQVADGDLAGALQITDVNGKTGFSVKASGAGIRQGNFSIVKPKVDLSGDDILSGDVSGMVTAQSLASGTNALTGLQLSFNRASAETLFDLKAVYDSAPLTTNGVISSKAGGLEVTISAFSASPRKIPVKLASPSTLGFASGTATFGPLVLATGRGQIALSGSAGATLDVTAKITSLPAALANGFVPGLGAEGTLSGTVTAKGTPSAPSVTYAIDWNGAAVSQTRSAGLGALGIKAKGSLVGKTLKLDANLAGDSGLALVISGNTDLGRGPALALKVNGSVPFALLASRLSAQGITMSGSARIDINVSGSPPLPAISGTITTTGARLTDVRRNLTIANLAATVRLNGQTATIASLSGDVGSGGKLTASGTLSLATAAGMPADIAIKMSNIAYADGNVLTAQFGADFDLKGPLLSAPTLSGKINVVRAAIAVPERLSASLAEINVQHKNASQAVITQKEQMSPKQAASGQRDTVVGLDLKINAPRQVFVRGRGIDAELGGQITVRGTAASPIVAGSLKMVRGRMDILGRRLDFSSGTIGFGGNMTPTLSMLAATAAQGTTIEVSVTGEASNPQITFSSSPALPQDEVLAKLIFGRSLSGLSALQIAQLADAVAQLAGSRSGSLFTGLRARLGVDDLDVSTDAKGRAQVRAGKYINNKTYLEVQQGADRASSKAAINLDIGKGVKLRGEAGADGSGAAGIFFEKEY